MLVMVLDGTFHKTYVIGLLAYVQQSWKHELGVTRYFYAGPFPKVQINTEFMKHVFKTKVSMSKIVKEISFVKKKKLK